MLPFLKKVREGLQAHRFDLTPHSRSLAAPCLLEKTSRHPLGRPVGLCHVTDRARERSANELPRRRPIIQLPRHAFRGQVISPPNVVDRDRSVERNKARKQLTPGGAPRQRRVTKRVGNRYRSSCRSELQPSAHHRHCRLTERARKSEQYM